MRAIGELEALVMQQVWSATDPVTVHDIIDGLERTRRPAYTTVITIAERLRAKGLLQRTRVGRAYQYSATVTSQQFSAELIRQVLSDAHDPDGALLQFVDDLPPDEVARLRAALDDASADRRGRRSGGRT